MTQDKAQAAGAVSIDSPTYLNLLADLRRANTQAWLNTAEAVLTKHIDAHAAQRYEAGLSVQAEAVRSAQLAAVRNAEETQEARASLGRLVEGVESALSAGRRWYPRATPRPPI